VVKSSDFHNPDGALTHQFRREYNLHTFFETLFAATLLVQAMFPAILVVVAIVIVIAYFARRKK
jgi:hypothetical protein